MIEKCRYHGEVLEFSTIHGYYICPISACKYYVDDEGRAFYGTIPYPTREDNNAPIGLIIQGEVIKNESSDTGNTGEISTF